MPIRKETVKIPQVDREAILDKEFEELEPHERRWLQDTAHWPEGEEKEPVVFYDHLGNPISNDPAFLLAQASDSPALRAMIEARAREMAMQMVGASQHQAALDETPYHGNAVNQAPGVSNVDTGGVEFDDDEEDDEKVPLDHMSLVELRNEAVRRDLPLDGLNGKKTGDGKLIQNIMDWDEAHPEGVKAYEAAKAKGE